MISLPPENFTIDYVASAFSAGGASRERVLRAAFTNNAPPAAVRSLAELRSAYFFSLAELRDELATDA